MCLCYEHKCYLSLTSLLKEACYFFSTVSKQILGFCTADDKTGMQDDFMLYFKFAILNLTIMTLFLAILF